MMWLSSLDDRYLLFVLTIMFAAAYLYTRDKAFSDLATLATGVTIGVLKDHASKTLIMTDSSQTKSIVNEFLGK